VSPEANAALEILTSMEELQAAVKQGKKVKAPGYAGISHDFFQLSWEAIKDDLLIIMNQMYMDGTILESQKHGIIVCVPKTHKPTSPEDYRPLTLMNADLKLLSRIIANRLRPWLNDLLHPSQYCGVHSNNILGALVAIWETIAHAELTNTPTCILSLDFKQAFDNIAHSYLYAMLENYGFSQNFRRRIQRI
jgi:hypothetical protein